MRVGFSVPQLGAAADQAARIPEFAAEAEALGVDSLWVGDRLLAPVHPTVGYPPGADTIPDEFNRILDPFTLLGVLAGSTRRVLFGSNVLNAPWYPPAVLARSLASVDVISRGRLVVGFGTGWSPEEFEAVGVPIEQRGRRLEESLDALERLWSGDSDQDDPIAEYRGEHWTVPATRAHLRPVQRPGPPVYLGGYAPAALRRVARRADGWFPITSVAPEADLMASVTRPWNSIRELAETEGRDPKAIDAIVRVYPDPGATVGQVVDTIRRVGAETDVEHVLVDLMFLSSGVDRTLELIDVVMAQDLSAA